MASQEQVIRIINIKAKIDKIQNSVNAEYVEKLNRV